MNLARTGYGDKINRVQANQRVPNEIPTGTTWNYDNKKMSRKFDSIDLRWTDDIKAHWPVRQSFASVQNM